MQSTPWRAPEDALCNYYGLPPCTLTGLRTPYSLDTGAAVGWYESCDLIEPMNLLLVLLLLLVLFGGGGFYFGGPAIGGGGIGLVLLIILIVYLVGGFRVR